MENYDKLSKKSERIGREKAMIDVLMILNEKMSDQDKINKIYRLTQKDE